jgi:hypothetical protein
MAEAIAVQVDAGLTVGTANLSPSGGRNILSPICNEQFGVGNDMWMDTGNLMFPWRPNYSQEDTCSHNPEAEMMFVNHVSIEALILPDEVAPPDVLDARHFLQLREQFDAAIDYVEENRPERVAAWGFVTHIIEYSIGSRGENPPAPTALEALDDFLSYVDSKHDEGLVSYATAAEIAHLASAQEP